MDLNRIAERLPSMGGTSIGPLLRRLARDAPSQTSFVEVGCWLGAGTAQLSLGIRERDTPGAVTLHCYDRWEANEAEVEKAARVGVVLAPGQDTLPLMQKTLEPFAVPVQFHQGDIRDARWDGGPISIYVDDASKLPKLFYHSLVTFGPSWTPGHTVVVLMDYHIWKVSGVDGHKCQKQFVEAHRACFEPIEMSAGDVTSTCAAFLYKAPIHFQKWVVANLVKSLDSVQRERRVLSEQVSKRDEKIRALQLSTSWRITAPLRWCADGLRSLVGARGSSSAGG